MHIFTLQFSAGRKATLTGWAPHRGPSGNNAGAIPRLLPPCAHSRQFYDSSREHGRDRQRGHAGGERLFRTAGREASVDWLASDGGARKRVPGRANAGNVVRALPGCRSPIPEPAAGRERNHAARSGARFGCAVAVDPAGGAHLPVASIYGRAALPRGKDSGSAEVWEALASASRRSRVGGSHHPWRGE